MGYLIGILCFARFIACFLQCSMNKTIFGIHDGCFTIFQCLFLHTLGCLIAGCEDFLGRFQMTYVFLCVLIILQQLDGEVTGRVALADGIICL